MQDTEVLRDRSGAKTGEIRITGSRQAIYDLNGHVLGRYAAQSNFTYDEYGRIVGRGNLLTTLLK